MKPATGWVGLAFSAFAIAPIVFASAVASVVQGCGGEEAKPPVAPVATTTPPVAPTTVAAEHADVTGAAKGAYDRGYAAFLAGDLLAAKQAFTEASRADPRAPAPLYSLGTVLEHQGDLSGAQAQYKAALAVKPDDVTSIGAYALCLATAGKLSEADAFLTNQQAKQPNSAPITTFLAEVKSMEGDTGTAQQLAQDALRMSPDYKPAMVAIAHDHYRARRMGAREVRSPSGPRRLRGIEPAAGPRQR